MDAPAQSGVVGSAPREITTDTFAVTIQWTAAALILLALIVAPFREAAERTTLLVNAGLGAVLLLLVRALWAIQPKRPIHLAVIFVYIGLIQPLALIVNTVADGNVTYQTAWENPSHHLDSYKVALARLVFYVCAVVAALAVGTANRAPVASWNALLAKLPPKTLVVFELTGVAVTASRLLLLFLSPGDSSILSYLLRVLVGSLGASIFFIGVALRFGSLRAKVSFATLVAVSAFTLMAGNRGDALVPMILCGLGYVVCRPLTANKLRLLLAGGALTVTFGLAAGEALRTSDSGARTGEAAMSRMDRLVGGGEVMSGQNGDSFRESTRKRLLHNSDHAVLTRVPDFVPFERNGLSNIPGELESTIVPAFRFDDSSDAELPRQWILLDFGFYITWHTAVEISIVADAWYRGGIFGLVICGLIIGGVIQGIDALLAWLISRSAAYTILLLNFALLVMYVEAHDLVSAVRSLVQNMPVGIGFVIGVHVFLGIFSPRPLAAEAT